MSYSTSSDSTYLSSSNGKVPLTIPAAPSEKKKHVSIDDRVTTAVWAARLKLESLGPLQLDPESGIVELIFVPRKKVANRAIKQLNEMFPNSRFSKTEEKELISGKYKVVGYRLQVGERGCCPPGCIIL
jgi:hypothetical protein